MQIFNEEDSLILCKILCSIDKQAKIILKNSILIEIILIKILLKDAILVKRVN